MNSKFYIVKTYLTDAKIRVDQTLHFVHVRTYSHSFKSFLGKKKQKEQRKHPQSS